MIRMVLSIEGEDLTRLKTLDPNVIYLGTTSKIARPAHGWLHLVISSASTLLSLALDLCTSPLMILIEHYFNEVDWQAAP